MRGRYPREKSKVFCSGKRLNTQNPLLKWGERLQIEVRIDEEVMEFVEENFPKADIKSFLEFIEALKSNPKPLGYDIERLTPSRHTKKLLKRVRQFVQKLLGQKLIIKKIRLYRVRFGKFRVEYGVVNIKGDPKDYIVITVIEAGRRKNIYKR